MAEEDEPFVDPFAAAESISEEIVDKVLTDGGKLLYDSYIAKKSYPFAADTISRLLVAELQMHFVRVDTGELQGSQKFSNTEVDVRKGGLQRAHSSVGSHSGGHPPEELDAQRPGSAPAAVDSSSGPSPSSGQLAIGGSSGSRQVSPSSPEGRLSGVPEMQMSPDKDMCRSDDWGLGSEPPRCRIDTWARACVPIRKKLVRPKAMAGQELGRRGQAMSSRRGSPSRGSQTNTPLGSRAPSRIMQTSLQEERFLEADGPRRPSVSGGTAGGGRNQQIPLVDDVEEDPEENAIREMKNREAKRHKEDDTKILRKQQAEAEESSKLASMKDAKNSKPFTYDHEGNVIWVQPPNVGKLPSTTPAPSFKCFQEDHSIEFSAKGKQKASKPPGRGRKDVGKKKKEEFADSFKRFPAQQPPMVEAMVMSPGVELKEKQHTKRGQPEARPQGGTMSLAEYKEMATAGMATAGIGYPDGGIPQSPAKVPGPTGAVATPGTPRQQGENATQRIEGNEAAAPLDVSSPAQVPAMKVVRSDVGADLVPQPPATPRPVQPAPPPSYRRAQGKRDALGYALSTRERVVTGTGTRFPGCGAQPPIGATMGHGLVSSGQRNEEYYFPDSPGQKEDRNYDPEVDSPPLSARGRPLGEIKTKNPELKSRLFGKLGSR
eukprot:TRINITY_DN25119_c0_g1_i1.p1 TRINITY_DN25119_c0_g1~~TRINITY_DN25119_c0_g1_i1.p1  ORF type:complete len:659 (-),score=141.86 TRINITY_DN25119_c0_g1_i1:69-2045(-)